MTSILSGLRLWRQLVSLQKRKQRGLPNNMRLVGRIWSEHLVSSNHGGLLFGTLLEHGTTIPCGRWLLLMWSCTIWSSKMGVVKASMTKDVNFRVSWFSRSLGKDHEWARIMRRVPPCASWDSWSPNSQIWLSISALWYETSSHLILFYFICDILTMLFI
jgi:hypothetical protein